MLVIGLVVFGIVKMMRGGNRGGASVETREALPVVDAYTGLPSAPPAAQPPSASLRACPR